MLIRGSCHCGNISFEGEDVESRIERRKRGWIGSVRFVESAA